MESFSENKESTDKTDVNSNDGPSSTVDSGEPKDYSESADTDDSDGYDDGSPKDYSESADTDDSDGYDDGSPVDYSEETQQGDSESHESDPYDADAELEKKAEAKADEKETNASNQDSKDGETNAEEEKSEAIKNKQDGCRREDEVEEELKEKYPEEEGYEILSEVYLRDENGEIVKDPVTGEARRIDFVVVKDGKVVDSVEVTSKTADKTEQTAKEDRIRENGGNYIKTTDGDLVRIPDDLKTRIERRD